jgi:hypothetical protein
VTGPRDWDKELAEIDKVIASGGPTAAGVAPPSPPARRSGPTAASPDFPAPQGAVVTKRRHIIGAWFKGILGVAGVAGLLYWPYVHTCGGPLFLYLTGVSAVIAAGIWTLRGSWTHRRGVVHTLGLLIFLAGLALATAEILPRVGYAKTTLTWTCN